MASDFTWCSKELRTGRRSHKRIQPGEVRANTQKRGADLGCVAKFYTIRGNSYVSGKTSGYTLSGGVIGCIGRNLGPGRRSISA
jgi:hypothetical protein